MKRDKLYEAVGKVEGFVEAQGELDEAKAMQELINSGMAWQLQGSMGRAAMGAIEEGRCMLGHEGHRDYWGNYVPARGEVKAGTKGSREFVAERVGEEWAAEIERG